MPLPYQTVGRRAKGARAVLCLRAYSTITQTSKNAGLAICPSRLRYGAQFGLRLVANAIIPSAASGAAKSSAILASA